MKRDCQHSIDLLHKWAALSAAVGPIEGRQLANWLSVQRLIQAARATLVQDAKDLKDLLGKSRDLLSMGDPLDEDFGAHLWLKNEREESYSDWLAWIIEQLQEPTSIAAVLGIKQPRHPTGRLSVSREPWILKDNEGGFGRPDLKISVDGRVWTIVEIKMGCADAANYEKQKYYAANYPSAYKVMIALSGAQPSYEKFTLRKWDDVCVELRQVVSRKAVGVVSGAMILAFVGAIEQNVLKLPSQLGLRINNGHAISLKVKSYLEKCVIQGGPKC